MLFPELINKVAATIKKYSMLSEKEKILVGFSGGPDSVCLLYILNNLKEKFMLDLHAVYIDHTMRPEETPEEIEFCELLCKRLNVAFLTKSIDVKAYAKEQGLNRQEAARKLRYKNPSKKQLMRLMRIKSHWAIQQMTRQKQSSYAFLEALVQQVFQGFLQ